MLVFDVPNIIETNNKKEFKGRSNVEELSGIWPGVQFINARSRHLQSQGLVEMYNAVDKRLLVKAVHKTGTKDCASAFS